MRAEVNGGGVKQCNNGQSAMWGERKVGRRRDKSMGARGSDGAGKEVVKCRRGFGMGEEGRKYDEGGGCERRGKEGNNMQTGVVNDGGRGEIIRKPGLCMA